MLLVLVAAVSLLTQAYVFRDTPAHPFDRCAEDRSLCPELALDSLLSSRERILENQREVARGIALAGTEAPVGSPSESGSVPESNPSAADGECPVTAQRRVMGFSPD